MYACKYKMQYLVSETSNSWPNVGHTGSYCWPGGPQ